MGKRRAKRLCARFRVGRISVYSHHGGWWIYFREGDKPVRRRVSSTRDEAERVAAELNAQVANSAPTMFSFTPCTVDVLRRNFLNHHEQVLRSSIATIQRYTTATNHLLDYVNHEDKKQNAHEVSAAGFVAFLRKRRIAPNGHPNTAKRPLRDKGIQYILEVCRSLFSYAQQQRHLPPYSSNPFAELRLEAMRIEDAKEIFVFDETTASQFLRATKGWELPIQFTLATTGIRPGELCHLLIDDLDLTKGWLAIRNKRELGWVTKTRNERDVPLTEELVEILKRVIGTRLYGPVFRRPQFGVATKSTDECSRKEMIREINLRVAAKISGNEEGLSRAEHLRVARTVWRDVGAFDADQIRRSFIRIAKRCSLEVATCPKSWRHTFATLLQDANADPLIRQITLGHRSHGATGALGMTGVYTHSRPETQAREIRRALQTWPQLLQAGKNFAREVQNVQ